MKEGTTEIETKMGAVKMCGKSTTRSTQGGRNSDKEPGVPGSYPPTQEKSALGKPSGGPARRVQKSCMINCQAQKKREDSYKRGRSRELGLERGSAT